MDPNEAADVHPGEVDDVRVPGASYYSLRNVLTQSPEKVKLWLMSVLGVIAGIRGWDPSLLETVGAGFALERTLDMLYVAPIRAAQATAVSEAHEQAKTDVALKGIELGKRLAGAPAPPAPQEPLAA